MFSKRNEKNPLQTSISQSEMISIVYKMRKGGIVDKIKTVNLSKMSIEKMRISCNNDNIKNWLTTKRKTLKQNKKERYMK